MDSIWTVSSFLIALLIAAGLALMAISNPPFDAIRLCFIAAAAVTGAATVLWATKAPYPMWIRATCAGVLGAAVMIILPETLRWLSARQQSSAASTERNTAKRVEEPDDISDPARRVFIESNITIKQLLSPPAELTSAQKDGLRQHCLRKWVRVTGLVKDVQKGRVELVNTEEMTGDASIHLEFDEVKLKEFQLLERGQPVTLVGRIYIANGSFLVIRHCETV